MYSHSTFSSYLKSEFPQIEYVFVTPTPNPKRKQTEYLTLLYQGVVNETVHPSPQIRYLSALSFWKLFIRSKPSKSLLHYHWLEFQSITSFIGILLKWTFIHIYRLRGGTLIWTVHNLHPHRGKWLSQNHALSRRMCKISKHILIHCNEVANQVMETYQADQNQIRVIAHPMYPLQRIPKEQALLAFDAQMQEKLNTDTPTLLFYGQVSSYKQITKTVKSILNTSVSCNILVAGRIMKDGVDEANQLQKLAEEHASILLFLNSQSDDETVALFSLSDAVILNYRAILDSGVFHLARSLETPIIARSIGCFKEWADHPDVALFETDQECMEYILHLIQTKHMSGRSS